MATKPRQTAARFLKALKAHASAARVPSIRRFFWPDPNAKTRSTEALGVPFGKVFAVAKAFSDLSLADIETLLDSPFYEVRMGAVSIMDFQARAKRITPDERKALFQLYLRRHDRINNWDLVDRAAPHVVGGYLIDRSRKPLHQLARSRNPWERRTAITATFFFLRAGETAETFRIAARLRKDGHELVQKAVGSWLREAGKRDPDGLRAFLKEHAKHMPRTMLRLAAERLPAGERAAYAG